VSLNQNKFSGNLPAAFAQMPNLRTISLQNNIFKGNRVPDLHHLTFLGTIPTFLAQHRDLEELNLAYNIFSGVIPAELSQMRGLLTLLLQGRTTLRERKLNNIAANNLTGFLPPELGKLTNLLRLDVSANFLGGTLPSGIGEDISSLEVLYVLHFSQNSLLTKIAFSISMKYRVQFRPLMATSSTYGVSTDRLWKADTPSSVVAGPQI
jgi:hypothetical protein